MTKTKKVEEKQTVYVEGKKISSIVNKYFMGNVVASRGGGRGKGEKNGSSSSMTKAIDKQTRVGVIREERCSSKSLPHAILQNVNKRWLDCILNRSLYHTVRRYVSTRFPIPAQIWKMSKPSSWPPAPVDVVAAAVASEHETSLKSPKITMRRKRIPSWSTWP